MKKVFNWVMGHWQPFALLAIVTGALSLRLLYVNWGAPLRHAHIDESVVVFYALRVLAGEPNPRPFFDYPSLFLYCLAAFYQGLLFLGKAAGAATAAAGALTAHVQGDNAYFTWAARVLSALMGTCSVYWAFRIGRLVKNDSVGLWAALLFALHPLSVLHCHYGTVDTAAVLFSLLALEGILRCWGGGENRSGAQAAYLAGLAAAVKYYPGVLFLFLLPVPFRNKTRRPLATLALWFALCAAGFLTGCPFALIEPAVFANRLVHLFPKIIGTPSLGAEVPLWTTALNLYNNAGAFSLGLALAGVVLALRQKAMEQKIVAAAFLFFAVFFGLWKTQLAHYGLFLYPLMFVLAALALERIYERRRVLALWAGVTAVLLTAGPMQSTLGLLAARDTREAMHAWIAANIPAGARLFRFAHTAEFSPQDPYAVRVDWVNASLPDVKQGRWPEGAGYLLYATYDHACDSSLVLLKQRYSLVHEETYPAPRFPHDPGVYLFERKTL